MNTWSQEEEEEQQELHESFVNRLYECKPVKIHLGVALKCFSQSVVK